MKRFVLILLALVLFAPMSRASIAYQGIVYKNKFAGTNSVDTLTMTNAIVAGQRVHIHVVNEANSKNISSIVDNKSQSATGRGIVHLSSVHNCEYWDYVPTVGLSVGDTITVTWSSAENTDRGYVITTTTGTASSQPDVTVVQTTSPFNTTVTTSITTSTDADYIDGIVVIQGDKTYTLGTGTQDDQYLVGFVPASTVGLQMTTFHYNQTTHGAYSPAGTINVNETALVILYAYKPAVVHTYYVDFVGGTDSLAGTATGTAWKHCPGDTNAISTANTTALVAGDTVIFKGGVTYIGCVPVKVSGSSGLQITYDGTGATWGTGRATVDCNNTYYAAFCSVTPNQTHDFKISGFEVIHCKNSSSLTNQSITRAGVDITGVNFGGSGDTYAEGGLHFNGSSNVILDGLWIHDFENCYDLSRLNAENDGDTQTDINVPCYKSGIEFLAVGSECQNITITNCQLWAIGRNAIKLFGVTNAVVVDCDIGGTSAAGATTNKGWFAVAVKMSSNAGGQPDAGIIVRTTVCHDGWQYGGDEAQQRSHAGDWFHLFGDNDGILEANDDCHDILFDRVYCYNDHFFLFNNGTSTFFIESDVYNVEWRNCLLVNDFADCIEMRDCSNMVVNATTIISGNTQPIAFKAGTHFSPKALKVRNCVFVTQSVNSAEVSMGTSNSGYTGDMVDSDYNAFYHPNNGGTHMVYWAGTYYTLAAWQSFSGNDTHSFDADPKLVSMPSGSGWANASSSDYRANSSQSSPLIGAGLDQSATFTIFRDGTTRTVPWVIGSETSFAGGGGGGGGSPAFSASLNGVTIKGGLNLR